MEYCFQSECLFLEQPILETSWNEPGFNCLKQEIWRRKLISHILTISEVCTMQTTNIKPEVHRLVEQLPDNATWDDLAYEIYIRQAIEAGVIESDAGRLLHVQEEQAKSGPTT
jgi:hypothetical protein